RSYGDWSSDVCSSDLKKQPPVAASRERRRISKMLYKKSSTLTWKNAMNKVGELERKTQDRVVQLFQRVLGYDYLGSWEERAQNKIGRASCRERVSESE